MILEVFYNNLWAILVEHIRSLNLIIFALLRCCSVRIERFQFGWKHHKETLLSRNWKTKIDVITTLHLSCAVNTSNHLHIVIDVGQWLCKNHNALPLVGKCLWGMKRDTGRTSLIENNDINLSAVESTLQELLWNLTSLCYAVSSIIFDYNIFSTSQFANRISFCSQLCSNLVERTDEYVLCTLLYEGNKFIVCNFTLRTKFAWVYFYTCLFASPSAILRILHNRIKTSQKIFSECRFCHFLARNQLVKQCSHCVVKCDNRFSSSFYLSVNLINYCIHFERKH